MAQVFSWVMLIGLMLICNFLAIKGYKVWEKEEKERSDLYTVTKKVKKVDRKVIN
ncbi:hypothetical protein [Virgibacillus halodenitrificans]|uniref:hypothetical protein n=1 Tax=Virgibacillus halodenitrificans TaxID=1482 RepID=UPI0013CE5640|nr:hypothetical protein [Virgibacillus halodenitrificans]